MPLIVATTFAQQPSATHQGSARTPLGPIYSMSVTNIKKNCRPQEIKYSLLDHLDLFFKRQGSTFVSTFVSWFLKV
jgi:hypothetical protein